MKLSILDQAVVSKGDTHKEALDKSIKLAVFGDESGYHRFWLAEHHGMSGFASSAPEITLSAIGQQTSRIRLGSGATLLPYYKPYKVAEVYQTLSALYPERIDLGIGRAPGGPAEASEALSDNYLNGALNMSQLTDELRSFLNYDNQSDKLKIVPESHEPPELWMLGTSMKSASSAGDLGLNYCFGAFMSNAGDTEQVIETYKKHAEIKKQKVMITVTVFCADTPEKANDISMSSLIWGVMKDRTFGETEHNDGLPSIETAKNFKLTNEEKRKIKERKNNMIIGDSKMVCTALKSIENSRLVDEIMISTNTYSLEDKMRSFELIKDGMK